MLRSRSVHVVKRPGSVRGKTSLIFPFFASKLSWAALTYSWGPWFGWHGGFAHCHPAMSCGTADGRSSWHSPQLPCSTQLSPYCFFHMGAPTHASIGSGEGKAVFLSISIPPGPIWNDSSVSRPASPLDLMEILWSLVFIPVPEYT